MNLLLLEPHEVGAHSLVRLVGRRAEHVRAVLRAEVGQRLRVGCIDGPCGTAEVLAVTAEEVQLAVHLGAEPPQAHDALLLAVPRPQVLLRMLAHGSALGFSRIVLFRSWRVDKSHLQSTAMDPAVQRQHLLFGLEQAGRTALPVVSFFPLFKPMVEDHLDGLGLPAQRFVAHPGASTTTAELALGREAPFALALGPDGGFLPYEVDQLERRGFVAVSCGPHPLRTEAALSVLSGQLDLLRRQGSLRS